MDELQGKIAEITEQANELVDRISQQATELAALLEQIRADVKNWKAGNGDTEAT